MFYNTTSLNGEILKQAISQANKQDDAVRLLFINTQREYSPSKVMILMSKAGWDCPLTSWRRSITNLTKEGVLEKTDNQVEGLYGRLEFTWRIKWK